MLGIQGGQVMLQKKNYPTEIDQKKENGYEKEFEEIYTELKEEPLQKILPHLAPDHQH